MNQSQEYNNLANDPDEVREIDLGELFSYYLSRIIWIIGSIVAGAVIAGLITMFAITPKYTATSTMYMVSATTGSVVDLSDLNLGSSLSSDYVELMKTRPIVESVIEDLDLDYTYEEVLDMVNLSVVSDTRIIKISVTSTDPEEAKDIANDLAKKAEKQLPKLMDTPKPNIAEEAIVPDTKSSPSLSRNVIIGAIICLVIMLVILTIRFMRDDTIKSAEDVEKYFGIMPLTTVPEGEIKGLTESESEVSKDTGSRKKRKSA